MESFQDVVNRRESSESASSTAPDSLSDPLSRPDLSDDIEGGGLEDPLVGRTEPGPAVRGLVEFLEVFGAQANERQAILREQAAVAKQQVEMLVFYVEPIAGHSPELQSKARDLAATRDQLVPGIDDIVAQGEDARSTASALGAVADPHTSLDLLTQWLGDAREAYGEVALAQAKVAAILDKTRDDAVPAARLAMGAKEPHMMRGLLAVADAADASVQEGNRRVLDSRAAFDKVKSSFKEKASTVTDSGDALNNAATGVGFGVVGALDAANVFNLATGTANVLGVIGGVLGIFFGTIGTILGIKNALRGASSREKLKKAKSLTTNEDVADIAEYAASQKGKKAGRNLAVAGGGLVAIGAGVVGLVALSVSTLGVAAIVAGIAAGLVGLGFVGFKAIRRWWKRRSENKEFASHLVTTIREGGEDADQAREIVSGVGMDPSNADQKGFKKELAGKVGDYVKSKRTRMAEGLVNSLVNGKPSERFDAELVLDALGVDPEWVRQKVTADEVNKVVSKVAGKMASW